MDKNKFNEACEKVKYSETQIKTIGTLGERTLHSVLKHYFEPDTSFHEIKVNNYYADIFNEKGIIEIQTRQFNKLRDKLNFFLEKYPVTLVYPIPYKKWLLWIDTETGEVTNRRLSPKKGLPYQAFFELYKIKNFLLHENLTLCIILIDIEEYRLLNGWSTDKKRGSCRKNRIPIELQEELYIKKTTDYSKLIPTTLPKQFSSIDFSKATKLSKQNAQTALNVLNYLNAVVRVGKVKNLYLYERKY